MKQRKFIQLLKICTLGVALLAGCAHEPSCGNAVGAETVYFNGSCRERIRQVVVGSELRIPSNIKSDALANFDLLWSDPSVDGGVVTLGHYDLVPKAQSQP